MLEIFLEENEMMKKGVFLVIVSLFLMAGCATTDSYVAELNKLTSFEEVDVIADFGAEYSELQGKAFYVYSTGNSNMNAPEVRNWALARAASVAYDLGFPAFTILNQYAGSEIRNETYYETYTETIYTTQWVNRRESVQVPRNVVRLRPQTKQVLIYYNNLLIGCITEDEFTDVRNVYRVSQYLPVGYEK
jgi:hypothetical protein